MSVTTPSRTTVGVILCGGRSSRMGGGDKTLLVLEGETLLGRIARRLRPQVAGLAINANGDADRFSGFDLPIIPDSIAGYAGPLAGILAALGWAVEQGAAAVLTVPGDAPFLPHDMAQRLSGAAAESGADAIAVASSGGRRHPVAALWPTAVKADLAAFLTRQDSRRVNDFLATRHLVEVGFEPQDRADMAIDPFFNINTPEELAEARRCLAGRCE